MFQESQTSTSAEIVWSCVRDHFNTMNFQKSQQKAITEPANFSQAMFHRIFALVLPLRKSLGKKGRRSQTLQSSFTFGNKNCLIVSEGGGGKFVDCIDTNAQCLILIVTHHSIKIDFTFSSLTQSFCLPLLLHYGGFQECARGESKSKAKRIWTANLILCSAGNRQLTTGNVYWDWQRAARRHFFCCLLVCRAEIWNVFR